MKMVSAAKYAKADRDLRLAKPYGTSAQGPTHLLYFFLVIS